MDQTSNVSSLKKLLQEKTQQDQQENRQLVLNEQQKLLNDLQNTYRSALNTTLTDIRESLKSRLGDMAMLTAQEAQTVEKMVEQHQEKLNKIMRSHYSQASKAIKAQTDPATQSINELTSSLNAAKTALNETTKAAERSAKASRRRWITGLAVGLSAFLIICAGSWGLIRYLSSEVQQNLATINAQKQTINELNSKTLGLQIIEAQNGTFLILPPNAVTGYSVGDKPAIKLSTN